MGRHGKARRLCISRLERIADGEVLAQIRAERIGENGDLEKLGRSAQIVQDSGQDGVAHGLMKRLCTMSLHTRRRPPPL